jgi:hypothetical protein
MRFEEMLFDFIQKIAVHMDKAAAGFTFQMKMFPAVFPIVHVLVTGAFIITQDIFTDLPFSRQFFKMPVDSGLPDKVLRILKMTYYLVNRHMTALKGLHIIEDALSLPGVVVHRTFTCHLPLS